MSVYEQAGLSYLVGNPKDRFSCDEAHLHVSLSETPKTGFLVTRLI